MLFSLNYKNRLQNKLLEQGKNFNYLNYNVDQNRVCMCACVSVSVRKAIPVRGRGGP
jgi:hypothetical protein